MQKDYIIETGRILLFEKRRTKNGHVRLYRVKANGKLQPVDWFTVHERIQKGLPTVIADKRGA